MQHFFTLGGFGAFAIITGQSLPSTILRLNSVGGDNWLELTLVSPMVKQQMVHTSQNMFMKCILCRWQEPKLSTWWKNVLSQQIKIINAALTIKGGYEMSSFISNLLCDFSDPVPVKSKAWHMWNGSNQIQNCASCLVHTFPKKI